MSLRIVTRYPVHCTTTKVLSTVTGGVRVRGNGPGVCLDRGGVSLFDTCGVTRCACRILMRCNTRTVRSVHRGELAGTIRSVAFVGVTMANIVTGVAGDFSRSTLNRVVCSNIEACFAGRTRRTLRKRVITITLFARLCCGGLDRSGRTLHLFVGKVSVPLALRRLKVRPARGGLSVLRTCLVSSPCMRRSRRDFGLLRRTVGRVYWGGKGGEVGMKFVKLKVVKGPVDVGLLGTKGRLIMFSFGRATITRIITTNTGKMGDKTRMTTRYSAVVAVIPGSPRMHTTYLNRNKVTRTTGPKAIMVSVDSVSPMRSGGVNTRLTRGKVRLVSTPMDNKRPGTVSKALSIVINKGGRAFSGCCRLLVRVTNSIMCIKRLKSKGITGLTGRMVITLGVTTMSRTLALTGGTKASPRLMCRTVHKNLTNSAILSTGTPVVVSRGFGPKFHVRLRVGSLGGTLGTTRTMGTSLPLATRVVRVVRSLGTSKGRGSSRDTVMGCCRGMSGISMRERGWSWSFMEVWIVTNRKGL